jgi:transposase
VRVSGVSQGRIGINGGGTARAGRICSVAEPFACAAGAGQACALVSQRPTNSEIASRLSWSMPTVGKWRQRFVERRVQGLYDELRPCRPRSISDEKVRVWLATRPGFQVHYTPTYSSWLNQVERWFGIITQRAIRRGSFRSVRDLITRINQFVEHYNRHCRPFAWTATTDSIFQKLARLCSRIYGTQH